MLRNDTEAEVSTEQVIAFDRMVTLEDKADSQNRTDPDVPFDNSRRRGGSIWRATGRGLADAQN